MAYTYNALVALGPNYSGLTNLIARAYDTDDDQVGTDYVGTDYFTESPASSGFYQFEVTDLDDDFIGYFIYYTTDELQLARSPLIVAIPGTVTDVCSLAFVKNALRITTSTDDELIVDMLNGAVAELNKWMNFDSLTYWNYLTLYEQSVYRQALVKYVGQNYKYRDGQLDAAPVDNPALAAQLDTLSYIDIDQRIEDAT